MLDIEMNSKIYTKREQIDNINMQKRNRYLHAESGSIKRSILRVNTNGPNSEPSELGHVQILHLISTNAISKSH